MFKLPVCPYCNTVYSYKEVKKSIGKKNIECYHCKNCFKSKLTKRTAFTGIIFLIIIIFINILILKMLGERNSSLLPLFFIDIVPVIGFYFLIPFTVSLKKSKEKANQIPDSSIIPKKTKLKRSEKTRKRKESLK